MKHLLGVLLLILLFGFAVLADEITANEFLAWAESNNYSVYTNWVTREDGYRDVVMAAVDSSGNVPREAVIDARSQRGYVQDSGESFEGWLERWGHFCWSTNCGPEDVGEYTPR